jgi:rhodanese-related sulfurtransferase
MCLNALHERNFSSASFLQSLSTNNERAAKRTRIAVWVLSLLVSALLISGVAIYVKDRTAVSWENVDTWISLSHAAVESISTDALSDAVAANRHDPAKNPLLLLDIREAREFAVSRIPGSRHVTPTSVIDFAERELAQLDRSHPIFVYCSVGVRSAAAAEDLRLLGFTHVKNLRGSIFKWANEGRLLEGGAQVHPFDAKWGQLLRADLRAEQGGPIAP